MRSSFISWSQCACAHALRLVAFGDHACGKQHGSHLNDHRLALCWQSSPQLGVPLRGSF
ncbi:hypothetical protein CFBP2533_16300 [Xanthomonas hortorum pv. pelargonii]|uniref:Uncharacterized protein n=1 Tax=Xanthomonas hortorum pv. pelargonii TaxID=453602 RepID=A0A6V7CRT3_9XANT|nr:hypothetical protein CFBP2533_16300 [Xanthomonas hortorum pv. pelargonii]CAD0321535.1 hypothetical protein CFBP2533_16300 [Xanthomonas hortorum pv. pelargonii]